MQVNAHMHSTASPKPEIQNAVQQLEASFWAEMLRSSNAFDYGADGGIGAEQFKSFLIEQQSQILARAHPLGLGAAIDQSRELGKYGEIYPYRKRRIHSRFHQLRRQSCCQRVIRPFLRIPGQSYPKIV